MTRTFIILGITTLALGSCMTARNDFSKRKYTKGWFKKSDRYQAGKGEEDREHYEPESYVVFEKPSQKERREIASIEDHVINPPILEKSDIRQIDQPSCDVIMLKDGTDISSKVVEIGTEVIKYKKCDSESGPTYTVKRNDVFKINYANGTSELISPISSNQKGGDTERTSKQTTGLALSITGIVLGTIGTFFFLWPIVTLIFGVVAIACGIIAMKFAQDADNRSTSLIFKLGIWAVVAGGSAVLFGGLWLLLAVIF